MFRASSRPSSLLLRQRPFAARRQPSVVLGSSLRNDDDNDTTNKTIRTPLLLPLPSRRYLSSNSSPTTGTAGFKDDDDDITSFSMNDGPLFPNDSAASTTSTSLSGDDALDKLLSDAAATGDAWYAGANAAAAADGTFAAAEAAANADAWIYSAYSISDNAIWAISSMHEFSGWEYGWSIVGVTFVMRVVLFPVMIVQQRTSARMAHLQPELQYIKNRYEALGPTKSRQDQLQMSNDMKKLFAKYDVKPGRMFIAPLVQLPMFMGMFFGLQKMPTLSEFYIDLATGGMFWFPDLTVPDPHWLLPTLAGLTFLGMIELGKKDMASTNPANAQMMTNVFRVMAIGIIPFTAGFPAGVLCYWTTNNCIQAVQTIALKQDSIRRAFGIWDRPKPIPGQEAESFTEAAQKLYKRASGQATSAEEAMKRNNAKIEKKRQMRTRRRAAISARRGQV